MYLRQTFNRVIPVPAADQFLLSLVPPKRKFKEKIENFVLELKRFKYFMPVIFNRRGKHTKL